ncbi:MAG: DUF2218 domain-containing protein [Pseudochelatococcus sp.]|jgi:NADPH-dependent ferric siderophore reductase|uniref:DUF2218 domain-containing protein n=1 Tax=Pseudochelatococcus sp. TaxID=2020869 RepID=UPI003D8B7D80
MTDPRPTTPRLAAATRIALADPRDLLNRLCDHLAEHVPVERLGDGALFRADYGTARVEIAGDALTVALESGDDTGLSFLKLIVAEHVLEFAGGQEPAIRWTGDGRAAGEPLPYFREMRVASVTHVTPRMRRIVLSGEDLGRFATGGLHVRLLFPPPGPAAPQWPVCGEDGRPQWPQGAARPAARVYTIRHIDVRKGEVAIDMMLHGDGHGHDAPGAGFARHARPGDIVGMTGPGGSVIGEARRYIMLGDETALPAIARQLETLPAHAEVAAFVEVADAAEEQPLTSAARLDLRWLHRDGTGLLERALRDHPWLGDGGEPPFIWAGCEHAQARAIRRFALKEAGLTHDGCHAFAYWRRGAAGDDARED